MCASSLGAIMRGLQCFLREQTCSNLEMMDGLRQLTIAALSSYNDWSRVIAMLYF